MTLLVGLFFGLVYFAVDYGLFHLVFHARSISENASLFLVLLWMSMSYGFTNFVWIWLWISKDKRGRVVGAHPVLVAVRAHDRGDLRPGRTHRHPADDRPYHGYMAILLFAGYFALIVWNLAQRDKSLRANLLWLLAIGILVQFGWEPACCWAASAALDLKIFRTKLLTLVTNSLLETNLGLPYIYAIFLAFSARFTERLRRRAERSPCANASPRTTPNRCAAKRSANTWRAPPNFPANDPIRPPAGDAAAESFSRSRRPQSPPRRRPPA